MNAVYAAALAAHEAGLCILPPRQDGTKAPDAQSWTAYQKTRSTRQEIDAWYATRYRSGLGYLTGAVSGGLILFDFDDVETHEAFNELAGAAGLGELVERIEAGYLEASPHGRHWLYRCEVVGRGTKLASRPKRSEERQHDADTIKTKIETKAEGGYVVVAPSTGRIHPSGLPYRQLRGGVATIATVTPEEQGELFAIARALDEMPKKEPQEARTAVFAGGRPGDDYNRRGDVLILLQKHGWHVIFQRNGVAHLRRPGKERGTSATFGFRGTRYLYVFSTSTVFEANRAYSPFTVYATLEHGLDFGVAARALAATGYGQQVRAESMMVGRLRVRRAWLRVREVDFA